MRGKKAAGSLAALLRQHRLKVRSSQRVLADFAQVRHGVVGRAERAGDLQVSTWERLFEALGCRLVISVEEIGAEDCEDYLLHETDRRHWRRIDALKG